MAPPLALDIDGTLTAQRGGIDPDVIDVLHGWDAPIVLTTGKAFPYPVALAHYAAIPERVVAENGGILHIDGTLETVGRSDRIDLFREALDDAGLTPGWGAADLVNRWRETEFAVERSVADRETIADIARSCSLEVVDSGYAYHVKDPAVSKGQGLERACSLLGLSLTDVVAIGDSENDVSTFERVGTSFCLANGDEAARAAADVTVDRGFAPGTLQILAGLDGPA